MQRQIERKPGPEDEAAPPVDDAAALARVKATMDKLNKPKAEVTVVGGY